MKRIARCTSYAPGTSPTRILICVLTYMWYWIMEDLSYEDMVEINKKLGEKGTVLNSGNLHFLIEKEKNAKTLLDKAAVILYGIITSHPFLEGNKRTGFNAMLLILEANGKKIKQRKDEDIGSYLYEVAQNKFSEKEVKAWISELIE